jgi:hypothetical protein
MTIDYTVKEWTRRQSSALDGLCPFTLRTGLFHFNFLIALTRPDVLVGHFLKSFQLSAVFCVEIKACKLHQIENAWAVWVSGCNWGYKRRDVRGGGSGGMVESCGMVSSLSTKYRLLNDI